MLFSHVGLYVQSDLFGWVQFNRGLFQFESNPSVPCFLSTRQLFTRLKGFHVDETYWELSDQKLRNERLCIQDHDSNVLLL